MDTEHEVHTFSEAKHMAELFIRRLKHANPDAQIMLYMGRGRSTARIHFHMVSNGLSLEAIEAKWKAGAVLCPRYLRENNYYNGVNHGQDYTGLANYLFNHWTPEQGGHRWKSTRNIQKPDVEQPTVVKRKYSESRPPKPPKGYTLVESSRNQYGYMLFKYVRLDKKKPNRRRC